MRRRELVLLLTGVMAASYALRPQQKAMRVIGYFASARPDVNLRLLPAFLESETGWIEGQNVAIEYRWAGDHYERLPALASDLVSRNVDLIVSTRGITGALAAKARARPFPSSSLPVTTRLNGV